MLNVLPTCCSIRSNTNRLSEKVATRSLIFPSAMRESRDPRNFSPVISRPFALCGLKNGTSILCDSRGRKKRGVRGTRKRKRCKGYTCVQRLSEIRNKDTKCGKEGENARIEIDCANRCDTMRCAARIPSCECVHICMYVRMRVWLQVHGGMNVT